MQETQASMSIMYIIKACFTQATDFKLGPAVSMTNSYLINEAKAVYIWAYIHPLYYY